MATTKFRTIQGDYGTISPMEVTEENGKIYTDCNSYDKSDPNYMFHDTFEDAKDHLIGELQDFIKTLSEQLAAEKANLAKLQELTEKQP